MSVEQSYRFVDNEGAQHQFPNAEDLKSALPGLVRPDGSYEPQLVNDALQLWFQSGQSSCLFARQMAQDLVRNDWFPICITPRPSEAGLAQAVSAALSEGHEATQFVFPDADSAESLADLMMQFDRMDDWHAVRLGRSNDIVHFGLRWSGVRDDHVAWALGFAPLSTMPHTRRAPFTTLILRSRAEYHAPRKHSAPTIEVHLADLCRPEEIEDRLWNATIARRKAFVEEDLAGGARAQATFSVPVEVVPSEFGVL